MSREKDLYGRVTRFVRKRFELWVIKSEVGTKLGKVDLMGLREVSGDLATSGELIAIEVKGSGAPFLTSIGQAFAYSIYSHKAYLAVRHRDRKGFTLEERDIAAHFGVGLINIGARSCQVITTSRRFSPQDHYVLNIYAKLGVFRCSICGGVFEDRETASINRKGLIDIRNNPEYRGGFERAISSRKNVMYWLYELSFRKRDPRRYIYDRRYFCRDCVSIFASLMNE